MMAKAPQDLLDTLKTFDESVKGVQVRAARNGTSGADGDMVAAVCNDARERVTKYRGILRGQSDISTLAPARTAPQPRRKKSA
jgi:hypothetical protein